MSRGNQRATRQRHAIHCAVFLALFFSIILPAGRQTALAADPVQVDEATVPAAARTPVAAAHGEFLQELEDILAREREQLEALDAEFEATTEDEAALAVQRRIAELKQATELALLGAQVRYARRLGNFDLAERIEADIAVLQDPQRASKQARPDDSRH